VKLLSDKIQICSHNASRLVLLAQVALLLGVIFWVPVMGQEGIIETFVHGKKVSPYLEMVDADGRYLAGSVFYKTGIGHESNVFRAPYIFDTRTGTGVARQYPSGLFLPRSDTPLLNVGGIELGSRFADGQKIRLMLAGQLNTYPEQPNASLQSLNAYTRYRIDFNRSHRLELNSQLDKIAGTSTTIHGVKRPSNLNSLLHSETSLEYQLKSIDSDYIGRGWTQLMGMVRVRNYDEIFPIISFLSTGFDDPDTVAFTSINDTLEADYWQYRLRLRHIQGLWHGFTTRMWGDYIRRRYLHQYAKQIANDSLKILMASIPIDTLTGRPPLGYPQRGQLERRLGFALQYDPPHTNNVRFMAGVEYWSIRDLFQDFYSYDQLQIRFSASYTPDALTYLQASLQIRHRKYLELSANYDDWWGVNRLVPPGMYGEDFNAIRIVTPDTNYVQFSEEWKDAPLETKLLEMSLRGQVPITNFMALWGLYNIDARLTSRPPTEYLSREYFNQSVAGGVTFFLEVATTSKRSLVTVDALHRR